MKATLERKSFPLRAPFSITGYTFHTVEAVWVSLEENGFTGHGEGVGVYYTGDTADCIMDQLETVIPQVEKGVTLSMVQDLLPPGGARNALDSALWDLQAKKSYQSIWERLHINAKRLSTVATIGIGTPDEMAATAIKLKTYPNLKVKLSNDDPITKLNAIREARPDATLIIDVNQGWNFRDLNDYLPDLLQLNIAMIEQPLPRGLDHELEGFKSPVPLGADESCLGITEYPTAARRYDVINIKLDKCGGLSEGLELVRRAQRDGKGLMIGNMTGTSLSMAPAYIIGQFCNFVDIDGPMFLQKDINNALQYEDGGLVSIPTPNLWG